MLLSARAPETTIELGITDGNPILIDVAPQLPVTGSGATIAIFAGDAKDAFQRVTLYPADRPARFIVRVPSSAKFIRLRLKAIENAPLPDVEVSLAHKPVDQ